jgi:hypothetical protein
MFIGSARGLARVGARHAGGRAALVAPNAQVLRASGTPNSSSEQMQGFYDI